MSFEQTIKSTLGKLSASLSRFLKRGFFWKTLLLSVCVSYFFHFPNYGNIPRENPNKVLLEIKDSIFEQVDYESGSHAAKKTLRISIPLFLRLFQVESVYGIHFVFAGFNLLFLSLLILWLKRETDDSVFSFLIVLGFVCIFPGNAGFCDTKGWGDIIPYTFLLFAVYFRNPLVIFASLLIAFLGDERSLIGCMFVFMWWCWKRPVHSWTSVFSLKHIQLVAILLAFFAFIGCRLYLTRVLGFENKLDGFGFKPILSLPKEYIALGFWSSFEAFWLFSIVPVLLLGAFRKWFELIVYVGCLGLCILASYTVHDITKSISYGYLACLGGAILLHRFWENKREIYYLAFVLGCICLIAPTQHIFGSHWLYAPFPVWLFEWLKVGLLQS